MGHHGRLPKNSKLRMTALGPSPPSHPAALAGYVRSFLPKHHIRAHALQIDTGRFRQDPLIEPKAAINIYAAWGRNSTQGAKRVAFIERNFASFADSAGTRSIDLVSVLDKGAGLAVKLLSAILDDARTKKLEQVQVLTDSNNLPALRAYSAAGFQPERSLVVFPLLLCR